MPMARLLDDIGPMVMNFLQRRVRDAHEVQDVYQEIFMALHRAGTPTSRHAPWSRGSSRIARRVATDHQRRRLSRHARGRSSMSCPRSAVESDAHLKPQLEQAVRVCRRISGARSSCSGWRTPDETAARRAGTTVARFKVRAHRAYKVLRQLL